MKWNKVNYHVKVTGKIVQNHVSHTEQMPAFNLSCGCIQIRFETRGIYSCKIDKFFLRIFGFVPQKVPRRKPLMISTPRVPNQKVVTTARKYNTPHHFVWSPLVNYNIIIILINLHTCDFHTHCSCNIMLFYLVRNMQFS